jgi:hypothetical protein
VKFLAQFCVFLLLALPAHAWWDEDWAHYKEVTISSATGAGTNYQVRLDIGASTGGDFHLEGNSDDFPAAEDDGGDLRFLDNDDSTELDFWVEDSDGSTATVWVEVQDDLSSSPVTINVYYGNDAGSLSDSDGESSFLFFDDFDDANELDTTTKWDTVFGTPTVSNGILELVAHEHCKTQAAQGKGRWRVRLRWTVEAAVGGWQGWQSTLHGGNYFIVDSYNADSAGNAVGHINPGPELTQFSVDEGNWHTYQLDWFEDDQYIYQDGVSKGSDVGTNDPSGTMYFYLDAYSGITVQYDWMFRGKFVNNEPDFSSAGVEQSQVADRRSMTVSDAQD